MNVDKASSVAWALSLMIAKLPASKPEINSTIATLVMANADIFRALSLP